MSDGHLPYDPDARRDTPLALRLKERIRKHGPITVAEYMQACLQDPEHGYYVTQKAIGRGGDFITAPEISQVFGELIGLWCAVVWQQMGSPARVNLIELGPGRGTLMKDALRASRIVPGFHAALSVHLVESSRALREAQEHALANAGVTVTWHASVGRNLALTAPSIVIGNEYLDAHPVMQMVLRGDRWLDRCVGLDAAGRLIFVELAIEDEVPAHFAPPELQPRDGDIIETSTGVMELGSSLIPDLGRAHPFAMLLFDYGHTDWHLGDTLQAVRSHRAEHPLTSPGEADLTTQVNFKLVEQWAGIEAPAAVDGPTTQAEFMGRLGIMERASRLMSANPAKAAEIEMGVARLMAVPGMGSRFKAIGIRPTGLPPLPGF